MSIQHKNFRISDLKYGAGNDLSQRILELQKELTDTEDKIQASRRFYNGNVRDFNTKIQTFPNNVAAGIFGFKSRDFFEIEEAEAREPVKVKF